MIGGYRSAASIRRAVLPAAAADTRPVSTTIGAVDDWYIPDREVFGPVPTHEEAMAATIDLREAFEMCVTPLKHNLITRSASLSGFPC
jgi:hypothetical protein